MKYLIFNSQGAAETAQKRILKLWSQYLFLLGYGRDGEFVVNTGIRSGVSVSSETNRWSNVIETTDGKFAIIHPETHTFADGTVFDFTLVESYDASVLAQLGITPTPNLFGASYTEAEIITPLGEQP